ncbi:cytochrome-c oxidase, cbb3-type subunit III [Ancylobacter sp. A5.8]|uniref:cytochrome-c oxidase, cbb3-type subunit III n=1 Tax=Ancylobacter gelatini TaxID=2919920 RepID=UPI001F4ED44A|nr:cytochrome-c oxidase, cbb3-type subunit III [Ancylobacter gelatini]MCJ8143302.1 cytochrome-c oxidase, cbb3-type subunit III [Ancylobacter gelatini]
MKPERDPVTGRLTTGHEWNGLTELDTPVPKPVYFFLIVFLLFCVGYWLLMPAWPLGTTYTKGLLHQDERASVTARVKAAAEQRASWTSMIEVDHAATVLEDAALMARVRETGRTLFADNCAMCHGMEARGGPGFPSLVSGTPLWGATTDALFQTIMVGINSDHPDSRTSQMPAFGRDGILDATQIDAVVAYVRSLSQPIAPTDRIAKGRELFAANCAACHGEGGNGNSEIGVPDLTDTRWIYGGDSASIRQSIWRGRQGHMPSWDGRLQLWQRRVLALYLVDLRRHAP